MLSIQIKLSAQTTECDRGVWAPDVDPIQMFTRECLELWVVDDAMNTVQFRMLACENRFPNKELGLTCLWSAMGGGNDHCIPGNHWFPSRICKCLLHQSIYINCWLFYHVSTSINSRLSQTNGFIVIPICVFLSRLTRQRELWTIYLVWKASNQLFFPDKIQAARGWFCLLFSLNIVWHCRI